MYNKKELSLSEDNKDVKTKNYVNVECHCFFSHFWSLCLVFYYSRQNGLKLVFRENNAEWMQMSIDKLICQKEPSSRLGVFFLLSSASSYNTNLFSFLSEKVEFHAFFSAFTLISSSLSLTL